MKISYQKATIAAFIIAALGGTFLLGKWSIHQMQGVNPGGSLKERAYQKQQNDAYQKMKAEE